MRAEAPRLFEATSDNNQFYLEKVTWTLMGHHGKPSETETWWMPGAPFLAGPYRRHGLQIIPETSVTLSG